MTRLELITISFEHPELPGIRCNARRWRPRNALYNPTFKMEPVPRATVAPEQCVNRRLGPDDECREHRWPSDMSRELMEKRETR